MTERELQTMLKGTGIPVAYSHFGNGVKPPFLVYYFLEDESFSADDEAYYIDSRYNIELYTRKKDPALEKRLQRLLNENGIRWEKSEAFIADENVFEVLYQI